MLSHSSQKRIPLNFGGSLVCGTVGLFCANILNYKITNMIEAKKRDNQNLNALKGQMKDMSQDFEDMKNARIASKQRLEQRFTNVYT